MRTVNAKNEMSENSIFKTNWNDASEAEVAYTRLCVPAVLAAFFGLGTFLVYISVWFFFVGVIAILLSLAALWAIRNGEGTLIGTSLAYLGLCCGVVGLVSIFVFWQAYQTRVCQEADQFFRLWFVAAQQGDIPRAKDFQAIYSQRSRVASTEEWWEMQYKYAHKNIHEYVEDKLLLVLMALGDKATVSHYKTLNVVSERDSDTVASVYAVTSPGVSGMQETFFVRIDGKRLYPTGQADFKAAGWRLDATPALYLPDEFKVKR